MWHMPMRVQTNASCSRRLAHPQSFGRVPAIGDSQIQTALAACVAEAAVFDVNKIK